MAARSAASLRAQTGWATALIVAGIMVAVFGFQVGLMMFQSAWAAGVALAVAAPAITAGAILLAKARTAMAALWRTLAEERGWHYVEKDGSDLPHRFVGFKPFGVGGARFASHALSGETGGAPFSLFTYQYTVQAGKHSQTYLWSVVAILMPLDAPRLTIEREHIGHKLFDAMGGEDIDVESDAFSRRYWVRSGDRRFAYDVLHAPIVDYLLGADDGWHWQWHGHQLVAFRRGALRVEQAQAALELADGFRQRLPRHLLEGSYFKPGRAVRAA